ncbi:condensin complex subunit 1, partial [Haematococcus lacustris]
MAVDMSFCERHMQLFMFWLTNRSLPPAVRSSLVVAMGDLAARWPNVVDPWTPLMYRPLRDSNLGVRKTCLTVLSHLILNDMMKVKGHIAGLAVILLDEDDELREWTRRFFTTLASRTSGSRNGTNPVYNLLPDILSALTREPELSVEGLHQIMKVLLPFVKDTKLGDAFKEKLCARF